MRNPLLLLFSLLFVVLLTACHRPYAFVQRTPSPRFQSPQPVSSSDTTVTVTQPEQSVVDRVAEPVSPAAPPAVPSEMAPVLASTKTRVSAPSLAQRQQRIESLLHESQSVQLTQPRPRPKPRSQLRLGNRIRESLGLPLRQELNWWQRIDWKLKGSVFVIGIAILFAILGLGQLALLFGLIGAVLLVLGLKRSFKKRRPWF